jgi:hypothetical protein
MTPIHEVTGALQNRKLKGRKGRWQNFSLFKNPSDLAKCELILYFLWAYVGFINFCKIIRYSLYRN